ncbi:hypothetical protein BKA65DRAFT_601734 [Rhexocercosporidium sp. MPI-PUGE-AT-0058]|nr:hypothetical protein BKA65DRAFT_601734 [Rhexocercosporidium sp. MPI-PUGE-AT-0058]
MVSPCSRKAIALAPTSGTSSAAPLLPLPRLSSPEPRRQHYLCAWPRRPSARDVRSHRLSSTPGPVDGLSRRTNIKSFLGYKKGKSRATEQNEPTPPTPASIFWPKEFLVPDLRQARVWTYGYKADVIGDFFQANNENSISQHGRDLAVKLERDIENKDPIIFVAHSVGGILVKDALHKSDRCRERTKLVVFLETPHRGTSYANWAQIVSNLTRLGLQDRNKRIIQKLEVNSEVLDNIHEEFKSLVGTHGIKVHSFQEAQGISGMKGLDSKVVDDFSSKLDFARAQETVEISPDICCFEAICAQVPQLKEVGLAEGVQPIAFNTKPQFMVPFPKDEQFIGREDILARIEDFDRQDSLSKHKTVALVGLGGIGKSQIAIEYTYRVRKHRPQTSVFWIFASNGVRFKQAYQEIAEMIRLPRRDDLKANILQLVCDWLSDESHGRWVMILDNVDDADVFFGLSDSVEQSIVEESHNESRKRPLEAFLPQSCNGSILLTSRNSAAAINLVDTHGKVIQIEPMKEADSLALLETRIAISEVARTEAVTLVQTLEGILLAISHAAAYIRARPPVTIAVYLDLFHESEANQNSLLNNNDAKDLRRDHSTRDAVITTWQVSFNQIQGTNPEATDLLALMSMFDRQGIPERLLHDGTRRLQFEAAIAPLLSFSLIRGQVEQKSFEMHRLVQLSTRKWVELSGQLQRWGGAPINIVARVFLNGAYETWLECQELLPHSIAALSHTSMDGKAVLDRATIKDNLGWYLLCKGEYATAKVTLFEAINEREKELGVNYPDTLTSGSNLASVLERQGRYDEAEAINRRALAGYEQELGASHPDTLTSVYCLAFLFASQKRYNAALGLYLRAYNGYQAILGHDHPTTTACQKHHNALLHEQAVEY